MYGCSHSKVLNGQVNPYRVDDLLFNSALSVYTRVGRENPVKTLRFPFSGVF